MSSKVTEQARMVEVLQFEKLSNSTEVTPKLNYGEVKSIIEDPQYEKLPFFVMSLTGRKRNGKSFLANLLISKYGFQSKGQNGSNSWIDSNETVEGVEWKRNRDSVTKGIWMWSQPLIVTATTGQKVAVILLDCQGLYDPAPHQQTVDALITLYSLELSKLQIFNSKGDIDAADLQHLESSVAYAAQSGLSVIYNTLVLLHRDWDTDETYGNRGSYFENMEKKRSLGKTEQTVKEAFGESVEYTLPMPGHNIRTANVEKRTSLQEFWKQEESATFLECVDRLGDFFLEEYVFQPNHLLSQHELLSTLQRINEHTQDGSTHFTFQSPAEVLERRLILNIFEEVEDVILPAVDAAINGENYKKGQEEKLIHDMQQEENYVKEYLRQKREKHPTHTELGQKTWKEVDVKVEKWFAALKEINLLKFKRMLDKKKARALVIGLSIAGLAALGAATGGIGIAAAAPVLAIEVGAATTAAVATAGGLAGMVIGGIGASTAIGVENITERIKSYREAKRREKMKKE